MTSSADHAATVRANTHRIRDMVGFALAEKNIPREPTWTLLVPQALDNIDAEIVALADRATELERELYQARDLQVRQENAVRRERERAERAERERDDLQASVDEYAEATGTLIHTPRRAALGETAPPTTHGRYCRCTPCRAEDWDAIDAVIRSLREEASA